MDNGRRGRNMGMQTLVNLFIKIFIMIAAGFILRKRNAISGQLKTEINYLVINIIAPFSILASGNSEFSREISESLLQATIFCILYYALTILIGIGLAKSLKMEDARGRVFMLLSVFANTGFIGIPLATELFGSQGSLIAVIYNMIFDIFFFTFGVWYISRSGKFQLGQLLRNPVAVSAVLSVLLYLSPFRMPAIVADTFSTIGSAMVPLSMIVIGCNLAEMDIVKVLKNRDAYIVSALRLMIYPLIAFAAVKAAGFDPVTAAACVLLTALPPGTLNVIVAEQHNCAPEFATQAMVQSMVLMIGTLPLIMMLVL